MAASGVTVRDEVVEHYNKIKLGHAYQYIQFKLSDDLKEIMIDGKVEKGQCTYEDFMNQLPEKDCRYAVYDYHYTLGDAGERDTLVFIVWCPDVAPIKTKMLYASSKDALKKKLVGISAELQGTDKGDVVESEILDKCKKNK